jgi:hypothetical protein
MTVTAVSHPTAPAEEDEVTSRLRAHLDLDFLAKIGWIEETLTWRPPREDALVGYRVCRITGCNTVIGHRRQWCHACTNQWRTTGLSEEEFQTVHRRDVKEWDETICAVGHCERPTKTGRSKVCTAHQWHFQSSGQSFEQFLARPDTAAVDSRC